MKIYNLKSKKNLLNRSISYNGYLNFMKLKQGQIWMKGTESYRITEWARMTIQYKYAKDPDCEESEVIEVSKRILSIDQRSGASRS